MVWDNLDFPSKNHAWITPELCEKIVADPIFEHPLFHVIDEKELCLLVEIHHLSVFIYRNLPDQKQLRKKAESIEKTALKLHQLLVDLHSNIYFPLLRDYHNAGDNVYCYGFPGESDNEYCKALEQLKVALPLLQQGVPLLLKGRNTGYRHYTYRKLFNNHWLGNKRLANDFIDLCCAVSWFAGDDVTRNTVRTTIINHVKKKG